MDTNGDTKFKQAFIDVETTGLSPYKNFVWQIAIMIVIDGEIVETKDFKVKPPRGTILNKVALNIGNITKEDLEKFPDHNVVYSDFIELLSKHVDKYDKQDKFHFTAYNAHFDNGFVRSFFLANADNYFGSWFWSNNIDTMSLASNRLRDERHKLKNFKLGTVAEYLGIEPSGELHDGMVDNELSYKIYKMLKDGR